METTLNWETRHNIICGVAKALDYLHHGYEKRVIHRDITGTPGYTAPESFHTGKATVETNINAFGVLMLEVICGRKPGHQNEQNNYKISIVERVWEHHRMGWISDVIDDRLNKNFYEEEARCTLIWGWAVVTPTLTRDPQ
ncbi:hypothetical protein GOBAR_DD27902 [Gossypium barbadense]|nr:hypothetical protein GOBAR_DD27902 [Gossypium barbadense]